MKYAIFGCVLIVLLCLRPTPAQADLREWTSNDGKFRVEAELISSDGRTAKLRKEDGTTIDVPLAKLSDADRKFAESLPAEPAPMAILKEHTTAVRCVAFSPDGKVLVSGGGNYIPGKNSLGELILWNPATRAHIATLPSQGGLVYALAFSPDGKILAASYAPESSVDGGGRTVLWNFSALMLKNLTLKEKIQYDARALAFSSDGNRLVLGGVEPPPLQGGRRIGGIRVWDVKRSRQMANLVGHIGYVHAVALTPDGRTIASGSGSFEYTAMLWNAETWNLKVKLPEKLGRNAAIAISPDGATLALGTQSVRNGIANEVTLLDLKTAKARLKINVEENINTLSFSHDGKTLAVGTGWAAPGHVILLDPTDGKRIASLGGHRDVVLGVAFSADDKTLATGSTDSTVMLWDVSSKGLSEASRKLPKPLGGKTAPADLSPERVPDPTARKAPPVELPAGKFPESVVKFHKSMQNLRTLEAVRLEKRLKELQDAVRLGSKDTTWPEQLREAKGLLKKVDERLKVVKSDKSYVPRLSPKDFAIGQIGELDDDLRFHSGKVEGGAVRVRAAFKELSYLVGKPGQWARIVTWADDDFYVRAAFVAGLPPPERNFDRDSLSPTERLLKSHVYEIVDKNPRGLISNFVLVPYPMDEVHAWLKVEDAKRTKKP